MTLRVTFDINGETIYGIEITNHGKPYEYAPEHLRTYHWKDTEGREGNVLHMRDERAKVLVLNVLGSVCTNDGHCPLCGGPEE